MWYALVSYLEKMARSHMRKYLMLGSWNLLTGRIRDTRQQRPHLDVGWRASAWREWAHLGKEAGVAAPSMESSMETKASGENMDSAI